MRNKYTVEKRIADEHFIYSNSGIDYALGDVYYVLKLNGVVVAWSHTEKGAWNMKY